MDEKLPFILFHQSGNAHSKAGINFYSLFFAFRHPHVFLFVPGGCSRFGKDFCYTLYC
jgi:hypothetical protein